MLYNLALFEAPLVTYFRGAATKAVDRRREIVTHKVAKKGEKDREREREAKEMRVRDRLSNQSGTRLYFRQLRRLFLSDFDRLRAPLFRRCHPMYRRKEALFRRKLYRRVTPHRKIRRFTTLQQTILYARINFNVVLIHSL